MDYPKSKKEYQELLNLEGMAKGVLFRTDTDYVRRKEGEKGVKILQEKLKELDSSFDINNIKDLQWYPLGWIIVEGFLILKTFNWPKSEIEERGRLAPKYSFIIKTLARYFLSPKKIFEATPKFWEKHITVGRAESTEFNEKEKYLIIQIKDFKGHWMICDYLKGYLQTLYEFGFRGKKVRAEETKCVARGDSCHEFKISWE